jgi:hypothetical protein
VEEELEVVEAVVEEAVAAAAVEVEVEGEVEAAGGTHAFHDESLRLP